MQNYFYNILPYDIQHYIFQLRLFNMLQANYYRLISQKMTIANIVLNYKFQYFTSYQYNYLSNNLIFNLNSNTYMDTKNSSTLFLLKKTLNILTINDDKLWWLRKFIVPIENSLILYKHIPDANNKLYINNNIYYDCYYYYFELLKKLNITPRHHLSPNLIYQTI
tara:strand:- start:7036 stop:7530 length:495 start_codon:yes stop_codon:yes gene_type:complete